MFFKKSMEQPKPSYNIGDEVWILENRKAEKITITGIFIVFPGKYTPTYEIRYFVGESEKVTDYGWRYDKDFFDSKEELLASL